MNIQNINLGEVIRQKVEERGMSKAKFAELLGIARQNIEKTVFQKHGLDTDLLCNICNVLECNLFDYFIDADNVRNSLDYTPRTELRAKLIIEMGHETQDKSLRFVFGENDIEILNK